MIDERNTMCRFVKLQPNYLRRCITLFALVYSLTFPRAIFAQPGPAPVTAAPILYESVQSGQTFVGTVVPTRQAIIGSAVDGRVIDFKVNEGDRVDAEGDKSVLAQLLTATIGLEIKAAEKEYELRYHEHLELKNGSREEEISQAKSLMLASEATKKFAIAEFERMKSLYERGAVTSQEMEEVMSRKTSVEEAYKDRLKAYELMQKGPRIEKIAQAKARMEMQEAIVDKLKDQEKKYTIRSKFSGYVVQEFTEAGAWLNREIRSPKWPLWMKSIFSSTCWNPRFVMSPKAIRSESKFLP